MDHVLNHAKQTEGEAEHRLWPLEAFVAWLTTFLRTITGLKRRKVFPPNWKDHWPGLRELEWYRDQILAFSAKHVLAGGSLEDRTDFQLILEVPADYGICPHTPQAMNRRFITMAQFRLDPDKYIQRHIRRIAKLAGVAHAAYPALHAEAENNVLACVHSGLSRPGAAKAQEGSPEPARTAQARAPPLPCLLPLPTASARSAPEVASA